MILNLENDVKAKNNEFVNKYSGKIQTMLWALMFVAYVIATVVICKYLWEQFQFLEGETEEVRNMMMKFIGAYSVISVSTYVISSIILGIGLVLSLIKKLTVKRSGVVLCVFFVAALIGKFFMLIMGTSSTSFMWTFIEAVILIVLIILYFVLGKIKYPVLIYAASAEYMVRTLVTAIPEIKKAQPVFATINGLVAFVSVCIGIVLIFSAYCFRTEGHMISDVKAQKEV